MIIDYDGLQWSVKAVKSIRLHLRFYLKCLDYPVSISEFSYYY